MDFFVVGPRIALRSLLSENGKYRVDFEILLASGDVLGRLKTELVQDRIVVRFDHKQPVASDVLVEATRLVVRVLCKLAPVPIAVFLDAVPDSVTLPLKEDGLVPVEPGCWLLASSSSLLSSAKARDMPELYQDPYSVVWNFEPRPWQMLAPFLSEAAMQVEKRVLDVGCGFAKNTVLLEGLGFEAYGIDMADKAIALGRAWMRNPDRLQVASIAELPFRDAYFNLVLDVGCLHCLSSDLLDPGVTELARVLKPGGKIYSRVFKPRGNSWLATQNYHVKEMGLTVEQLAQLYEPWFEIVVQDQGEATLVRGVRRED